MLGAKIKLGLAHLLFLFILPGQVIASVSLSLKSESFLSPAQNETQLSQIQTLNLGLKKFHQSDFFSAGIDAKGFFGLNAINYWAVNPRSAFFGIDLVRTQKRSLSLSVGRRLFRWNHLDEFWGLGVIQPRFRWDYLNPETQGLTGVFLSGNTDTIRVTAFASPVFIPDQNPIVNFENGGASSLSRWIPSPSNQSLVFNKSTPIRYNVIKPTVQEVIFNPNAAIQVRIGKKNGPWGKAAYAYKPMNQFLLGFDGILNVSQGNSQGLNADNYPRLVYHHVTSLEGGIRLNRLNLWASSLFEKPTRDITPPHWTTQEVSSAWLLSPGLSYRLLGKASSGITLRVAYLYRSGGFSEDQGPQADQSANPVSAFQPRYPYKQATKLGLEAGSLRSLAKSLQRVGVATSYLYDLPSRGAIFSTGLYYSPSLAWKVGLGADIIGVDPSTVNDPEADFFHTYRGNDRVTGRLSYVF